jgi:hypothetical protein
MASLRLGHRFLQPDLGDRQVGPRLLARRERSNDGKLLERPFGGVQGRLRQSGGGGGVHPLSEEQEREASGKGNGESSEGRSQARDDRRLAH